MLKVINAHTRKTSMTFNFYCFRFDFEEVNVCWGAIFIFSPSMNASKSLLRLIRKCLYTFQSSALVIVVTFVQRNDRSANQILQIVFT